MNQNRKYFIFGVVLIVLMTLLVGYRMPYYIYKPGSADALDPIVQVQNGDHGKGDMHLVTVRGGQATIVQYLWAKMRPFYEIYPIEQIKPEGVSDNEYFHYQLQMMESSQEAATVVAYTAANKKIDIEYQGVYVMNVFKDMPANGVLEIGDRITAVDQHKVDQANDLIKYVEPKKEGEHVSLTIVRDGKQMNEDVTLAMFPGDINKVGMGISLVTDRKVVVDPPVQFKSGDIGGPSAGLMFSLEIYDQLTQGDLTHGLQIAGTGEITYDGQVQRIGGIDKKVVAADNEGCDIFFAPRESYIKEEDRPEGYETNYETAVKAAKKIGTKMKIVPVDTFQEALDYLENLK